MTIFTCLMAIVGVGVLAVAIDAFKELKEELKEWNKNSSHWQN